MRTKLIPMHNFMKLVRAHRDEILRWFSTRISNGVLEGINSLIQAPSGGPEVTGPKRTSSPWLT
jgi:hypothetical protein